MFSRSSRRQRALRQVLGSASIAALLVGGAVAGGAATLKSSYSPAADNGGGANSGRADIITLNATTDTITGAYDLHGTSAHRFTFNVATLAERNASGEIASGYGAVDGQAGVALGAEQKTSSVTYPDQIQGTRVATLVYDNALLSETPSTSFATINYDDTGRPVYGDLRLADITHSNVTVATGDKAKSVYDDANFAVLAADSGSTLYNVAKGSNIVYDSRTATLDGPDQDGLSQAATTTVYVPVTTYSGVTFNGNDKVTDLASLKRYNTSLIAQLTAGDITPSDYQQLIQAAAPTTLEKVVVENHEIPTYSAPPTTSRRLFMKLSASKLTTTADSQLIGVAHADGSDDGGSTLILAKNGATVVNNGTIVQAESGPGIQLIGAGTTLTNSATGVIGVGYETLDRSTGKPVPANLDDGRLGESRDDSAIVATTGATVSNQGIINVANRDIAGAPQPTYGKANTGIVASSGASASNSGTILIGGAASGVANTLGTFGGAAGIVAYNGGTATNAASGTIRIGATFAENAADLAAVTDVTSINYASGMASLSGGGAIVNDGTIRIGSLAQNATGMLVGGDGNTALNNGAITIDPSTLTTPSARNAAIAVRGSSVAGAVNATNAASGIITVSGVNGVGLLVRNTVAGGSARAVNAGAIVINGGISVDRLRNYGIFVANDTSSAAQNGSIILDGAGAIGAHARNGGTIDVGATGTIDFNGTDQIGYYALGAGSTINISSVTDVDTARSTGLRVEGGAVANGGNLSFNVSGADAIGIVGTGASSGTTVDTSGAHIAVSGSGAVGVLIEGGATGAISGPSAIQLTGTGATAAIVDGQAHSLDGTPVGAPLASTSLTSNANLTASFDGLTGYVARNQGQLTHSGTISFTGANGTGILVTTGAHLANSGTIGLAGADAVGIDVAGVGSSATHSGSIALTGTGTGVSISGGASFTNQGAITVASGTGILVDGAGSTLVGGGSSPVSVADGTAALRLVNGASVNSDASFVANGTAHGVLIDTGAGALTLGTSTITVGGTGNGIENAADSSQILLNGTTLVTNGSGAAIRTAMALDLASTATLTAAGTGSTGFDFAGTGGAQTVNDLTLGTGYAITASGVHAAGVRLATTGNATLTGLVSVTNAQGGAALVGGPAASITTSGSLVSTSTAAPVVDLTGGTLAFTNQGTISAASTAAVAIAGGDNGQSVTLASGDVTGAVGLGAGSDAFLMTGGTLSGAFTAGAGNDTATFRGLTDANMSGITAIAGDGVVGGSDALTFDATSSTGTQRLTGWNTIDLINGSALTADGDLTLAGGTVTIDATSTLYAGDGVHSTIGAGAGGSLALVNAGVIDLTNGASGATDTLTVRGNYIGQNGTIRLQTVLAGDGSPSDRLITMAAP